MLNSTFERTYLPLVYNCPKEEWGEAFIALIKAKEEVSKRDHVVNEKSFVESIIFKRRKTFIRTNNKSIRGFKKHAYHLFSKSRLDKKFEENNDLHYDVEEIHLGECPLISLTDRQREILNLYFRGLNSKQIAKSLGCSPLNVNSVIRTIRKNVNIDWYSSDVKQKKRANRLFKKGWSIYAIAKRLNRTETFVESCLKNAA